VHHNNIEKLATALGRSEVNVLSIKQAKKVQEENKANMDRMQRLYNKELYLSKVLPKSSQQMHGAAKAREFVKTKMLRLLQVEKMAQPG